MDFVLGDFAALQFPHQGGRTQAHLVHAVFAVDHQRMLGAQALQRPHLDTDQIGVEHAHQNIGRAGRVGEGPEDVEDGAHPQFTAYGRHVFHGRVVVGCKHEAHADLFDAARNRLRREVDVHAERLHHIGAAALAADTAPTVLADPGACGSGHKHGAGGDVEGVRAIAPGTHNIEQMGRISHMHLGRKLAHHLGGCGDLADGFFFNAQASDQGGHQHRRHLAAHDQAHDVQHFIVEDFAVLDGAQQRLLRGDFVGVGHFFVSSKG